MRSPASSDDAATKLSRLLLNDITADWSPSSGECTDSMNQFAVYENRFTKTFERQQIGPAAIIAPDDTAVVAEDFKADSDEHD